MANLIYDNFSDVFEFRRAIQTRPDNGKLGHSARDNGNNFSGMSLDDAFNALTDGLPEKAAALNREINRFKAVVSGTVTQRRPINYYNGHSPNVPAAIIGLPKSMRKVTKTPSKVKTVTMFYNNTANCFVDAEDLEKAGACVLQLVYWLELNGYRVRLTLSPYLAQEHYGNKKSEHAVCNILLKDYRQPLDLLKLSFSVTSVSMFRRLGFRWLETVPDLKGGGWRIGYGSQIDDKDYALSLLEKCGQDVRNAYFIKVEDCDNAGWDALKLAADLGIKVQ